MDKRQLEKNKGLFIGLSLVSIGCLVGSFAGALQKLDVYVQPGESDLGFKTKEIFITFETDDRYPWGFDKHKAIKVAQVHNTNTFPKLLLLAVSMGSASLAMAIGEEVCLKCELAKDVQRISAEGQKELILNRLKSRLALASKAEQLQAREDLKELLALAGGDETMEASEVNETDKFLNCLYTLQEGHSLDKAIQLTWGYPIGTDDHNRLKAEFEKWRSHEEAE